MSGILSGLSLGAGSGSSAAQNWSQGMSWSNDQSWNNSYGYNYGYSNSSEDSYSNSWGISEDSSWNQAAEDSWSRTFGREASAQDVINARAANDVEAQLWALQAAYNASEAKKSRDFQEYMSNTAYQRATQDLIKAGINPILAVGAMASTPVGATASSGLSSAHKANAYAESVGGSTYRASGGSHGYSKSGSNSESHSRSNSYNYGQNKSSGGSYGRSGSNNSAYGYDVSNYSNNIKEIAQSAMGLTSGLANSKIKANQQANSINKIKQTVSKKISNAVLGTKYHASDTYGGNRSHAR